MVRNPATTLTAQITNYNGILDMDYIREKTPAVFSPGGFGMSDRYAHISTGNDLLPALRDIGYVPTQIMQCGSRKQGGQYYASHVVRLRHVNDLGDFGINGEGRRVREGYTKELLPEIVFRNSADGGCAYRFYLGFIRFVCYNGMVSGDIRYQFSVRHLGDVVVTAINETKRLAQRTGAALAEIDDMRAIELDQPERLELARYAMSVRFGLGMNEDGSFKKATPYSPELFLRPRYDGDRPIANTLYGTTNIIQANMTKGGQRAYHGTESYKVREMKGANSLMTFNTKLMNKAEMIRRICRGLPLDGLDQSDQEVEVVEGSLVD